MLRSSSTQSSLSKAAARSGCATRLLIVLPAASIICISLGLLLPVLVQSVLQQMLQQLLPLRNGSLIYEAWLRPPQLVHFRIWLWNVTNPREVVASGAVPQLEQVGPFTFLEQRFKDNVVFHANHTVSYTQRYHFFYSPQLSVHDLYSTKVTSANLVYSAVCHMMRYKGRYTKKFANDYLKAQSGGLFVTRTANELLLGVEDGAIRTIRPALTRFTRIQIPEKMGLFAEANTTNSGLLLVGTGSDSLENFNRVLRWNGRPLPAAALRANATDGSRFPPGVAPTSQLAVFSSEICGTAKFNPVGSYRVSGIPVIRFRPAPIPGGHLNMSQCLKGAPLSFTAPHCLNSTELCFAHGQAGTDRHETRLNVEPITGFVLQASRLMQINLQLQRVLGFEDTEKLPLRQPLLLPLMWINETAGIPDQLAEQFKVKLLLPLQVSWLLQWCLIAAGVACSCAVAVLCCCSGSAGCCCCPSSCLSRCGLCCCGVKFSKLLRACHQDSHNPKANTITDVTDAAAASADAEENEKGEQHPKLLLSA